MGILKRLKGLFQKDASQENPERILHAFIESSSEKLRELSVAVSRSESERLSLQEKVKLHDSAAAAYRLRAEEAAKTGDKDSAKQWLEQAYEETQASAELLPEAARLQAATDSLKAGLEALKSKLTDAKELRDQYILRSQDAISQLEAHRAFADTGHFATAIDQMKEELLLAEAKAELADTKP